MVGIIVYYYMKNMPTQAKSFVAASVSKKSFVA